MNKLVLDNFSKVRPIILILPIFILFDFVFILFILNCLKPTNYINIQKDYFYIINHFLGRFPNIIFNLTQLGDALVILSFFIILVIYVPKIWEAFISGSLISLLFSSIFKKIFAMPRPAAILDNSTFIIIGKTLNGNNSLPSGHSITIFTVLTIVFFGFMPQKLYKKILFLVLLLFIGVVIISTRVGVGAHFPLDVFSGAIVGFLCGILGILFCNNFKLWNWVSNIKYLPVFVFLFIIGIIAILNNITKNNLIIFYFAILSLSISIYYTISKYVQKKY